MKILIITDFYYRGGLETFIYNLLQSWDEKDSFKIICNDNNPSIKFFKNNLKKNNHVSVSKFSKIIPNFIIKILKKKNFFLKIINYIFIFPLLILYFKLFFLRNNFERLIVINGGYPGSIYCRSSIISWGIFSKKKSIFNIHNMAKKINYKNFFIEYLIDFLIAFYSSNIITVSNSCANSIKDRFFLNKFLKVNVVYNGLIDFNEGDKSYQNHNHNYLLMLATFEERKGHEYLLKALLNVKKSNPKFITKIYGDGNNYQLQNIKNKIKKYNLDENVFIDGFIENPLEIIKNCKLMLVPSQEDESFGYTIIEAMSLSKPIISTNIGGIPEVLESGFCGYVCSKDDPNEFAEAIKILLNNDNKYKDFSINSRNRYIKHFSAYKMSTKYRKFLI